MHALRRNFVPLLVGVAAILMSVAALVVIVDAIDNDEGRSVAEGQLTFIDAPELLRDFSLGRALLGVSVEARGGELVVTDVRAGSPAEGAGVRRGDVIVSAAGQAVEDVAALRRAVAAVGPGEQYELVVRRGDAEQTLRVDRPDRIAEPFLLPPEERRLIPDLRDPAFDAFLDHLADEVADRLREQGLVPVTPTPSSGA